MEENIAIVVVAYNRPVALKRLLCSLENAHFGSREVPLIISIDKSESNEVEQIANSFDWSFGKKRVIIHTENLGLKKHVIACGDLTYEYDNVIILEDDLFVSPYFYDYSRQAYNFYKDNKEISGISLYSYDFNEHALSPFAPIEDGYDNYFMQMPSSIGQFFSLNHWDGFKKFLQSTEASICEQDDLPDRIIKFWPETSWKKYFYKYMLISNTYFVFPRISFTTNFGDIGTHFSTTTNNYQVNLSLGKRIFKFSNLHESLAIYDNHYELIPKIIKKLNIRLASIDFTCDLYGIRNKSKVSTEYLLSAKECNESLFGFALEMSPQELNICFNIQGNYFNLAKVSDFQNFDEEKRNNQILFDLKIDYKKIWYESYNREVDKIRKEWYKKGVENVMNSTSFKIGSSLLQPFRIIKRRIFK